VVLLDGTGSALQVTATTPAQGINFRPARLITLLWSGLLLAALTFLVIYPTFMLVVGALTNLNPVVDGYRLSDISISSFTAVLANENVLYALGNTLIACAGGTAVAVVIDPGTSSMSNPGAHGFSQALYAFSSAGNNNGSAFAGLSANTPFYNTALGIAMWLSRFWLVVPVLAIAGSLAAKKFVPPSSGTLPTHTPLFVGLLIGTVLLVGALTFVPALALGPVVEHLIMIGVAK